MTNDTTMTIAGNLTADPELGFTQSGAAWARFAIASTPRRYDNQTGQWVDGETLFLNCTAWRDLAEHVCESLHKGQRVLATGRLRQNTVDTEDGQKRTFYGLDVDDVGPSLRWATAKVIRIARDTSNGGNGGGQPAPRDPWEIPGQSSEQRVPAGATAGAATGGGSGSSPVVDEPPF